MTDIFHRLGACPLCGRKLHADRVRIIRETARTIFAGAECATCFASLLFMVIRVAFNQVGARENRAELTGFATMIGMVSDLTPSDARTLCVSRPLTADDVLALHRHFIRKGASMV